MSKILKQRLKEYIKSIELYRTQIYNAYYNEKKYNCFSCATGDKHHWKDYKWKYEYETLGWIFEDIKSILKDSY